MNGWKEYPLVDLCEIHDTKRKPISSTERAKMKGPFPYYGASGIVDYISDYIYDYDTILISEDGENLNSRKTPIAFKAQGKYWVNNHAHVLLPKRDYYFPIIINYLGAMDLNSYITGAVQPKLSQENLVKIKIKMPISEDDQRAIAGVLSSLDDKIDLLHRQNKTLEGMAEALWRKMFVEDADPNWRKVKIGDLVEETIGGDWGEDIQSEDLIPAICLRGADLQYIKDNGYSTDAPIRFIKPSCLEKRKLSENEIIIAGSGIGPIGKSIPINKALLGAYPYPVIYSNFCKRLRAESKEMAYFVEFMICQCYKEGELDQFHMGTSIPNFNLKDFLKYDIALPPERAMTQFSNFLVGWYNRKFSRQMNLLKHLRDLLVQKLMSGEIKLGEHCV